MPAIPAAPVSPGETKAQEDPISEPASPPLAAAPPKIGAAFPPPAYVPPDNLSPVYPPPGPVFPPPPAYPAAGYQPPAYAVSHYPPPVVLPPPPQYRNQQMNSLAVPALITSLIGLFPVGIVLAAMSIARINRTGERGRGQAVGALITSGIWMYVVYMVVLGVIGFRDVRSALPDPAAESRAMAGLRPGVCVTEFYAKASLMDAVPCSSPHESEVFAVSTLQDGRFPGVGVVRAEAAEVCGRDFGRFRAENGGLQIQFLSPDNNTTWLYDRQVICFATDPGGPRRGSLFD